MFTRISLACALTLASCAAWAQVLPKPDPGSIDTSVVITDELGKPAQDPVFATQVVDEKTGQARMDCAKCPTLTLGSAISHALLGSYQDERNLSGEQKQARGDLAKKARSSKSISLTSEEVTVVKKCLGEMYGPLVVSQAIPLIDPASAKSPPKVK